MDDFDRKFMPAQAELAKAGILSNSSNPPILALLRKIGVKSRPPHYAPFIVVFNVSAVSFACAWGSLMWHLIWSESGMSSNRAVSTAIMVGALFGIAMAFYYDRGRKKHGLTPWHKL